MSDSGYNEVEYPGGALGGRMSKLMSDAIIYTRRRMGPHQAGLAQKVLADFTNHVSDEIRGVFGPLWQQFADDEGTPDELRPIFQSLATERGQAWAWIGGTVGGTAISAGISGILNNMLAPVVQRVLAGDPNLLLSPEQAAAASIRGHLLQESARSEAAKSGLTSFRFAILQALAVTHLAPGEVLEIYRRGLVDRDAASGILALNGMASDEIPLALALRETLLSPADLAAMWNRGIVDTDEGARIAARSGVSREDFRKLVELGGEPPSPEALGEALRRGIIDRARYKRGITQGPVRTEWFDVLEELQTHRMSVVDAADAVNQGHMDLSEAERIARESGLDERDFRTLILTAGQPPGVEFAQEAWNRGLISESEFETMFLESRIKNRYMPLLKSMRVRLIPQETARLLYREGVYTREQTIATLAKHGFSSDDAAALIALEETRGDNGTRELTRAQVVDMYEEQLLTLVETVTLLTELGYSEESSRAMIELADLKRIRAFINAAVSRVRGAYVNGRSDEIEASSQLDRLGIPAQKRDQLMSLWDIDRTTVTKTLTAAQVRQALKKNLITEGDAMYRLTSQGYDAIDASLYLQLTS